MLSLPVVFWVSAAVRFCGFLAFYFSFPHSRLHLPARAWLPGVADYSSVHLCQPWFPPALEPGSALQPMPVCLLTGGVGHLIIWFVFCEEILSLTCMCFLNPQDVWYLIKIYFRFFDLFGFLLLRNNRTWNEQPRATEFIWRNLTDHLPHGITDQSRSYSVQPLPTLQEDRNLNQQGKNPSRWVKVFYAANIFFSILNM